MLKWGKEKAVMLRIPVADWAVEAIRPIQREKEYGAVICVGEYINQ